MRSKKNAYNRDRKPNIELVNASAASTPSSMKLFLAANVLRIFIGNRLTSGSSLTRLPSAKRVMLSNVVSVG